MQQRMREAVLRVLTASRADVPLVVITPSPPDSLQLLLRKRQAGQRRVADRHLTLVAFTDPNDLLSYTLMRANTRRTASPSTTFWSPTRPLGWACWNARTPPIWHI